MALSSKEISVNPRKFVLSIGETLAPLADEKKARLMQAYMRDQFEFLGISTPQRRSATMPLLRMQSCASGDALIDIAQLLWMLPQREYQYVAIDLLAHHWKTLSVNHLADLLHLVQQRSWWDCVDGLAGVAGDVIRAACARDPKVQETMDAALCQPDMWVRRVAMLHQLGWRSDTDASRLFSYARKLSSEPDFFIRKAIGWALRDYARHDPQAIREFILQAQTQLSPLSVREAMKHLT